MKLDAYLTRVQQAEAALIHQHDATRTQWRQLRQTWRSCWTPGRIVIAGLIVGVALGRGKPLRLLGDRSWLRLLQTLAPLLSSFKLPTSAADAGDADPADAATTATAASNSESAAPAEAADAADAATLDADLIARVRAAGA